MTPTSDIPTDDDFARADALEKEHYRGLSEVSEHIKHTFKLDGVHEFFIFYSKKVDLSTTFYAYIFYNTNIEVTDAKNNGLNDKIKKAVLTRLNFVGRNDATHDNVPCIFDSHQNVVKSCNGDYFSYLR